MEKIIKIKVLPRSSRNEIIKESDDFWRVKLTQAPVDNKANQALIKLLARELGVNKSQVEIIKREKSREKLVKIIF